jgi:hypothetical protein
MSLKQIFDSITPDNIKDIDLIKDAMEIFIENLEENSEISIDIKKIYESDNKHIRENLLKLHLNSIYNVITKAQGNDLIAGKLESHSAAVIPIKRNIIDILNSEYLNSNKTLKEKLGTKSIIEYTYNLAKYLQDDVVNANDFTLTEIKPFYFQTEGSIYREMYEYIVKPLSHPIGFTYNYVQGLNQTLTDYFGVSLDYNFNKIEIRCLTGHYDIFTPDSDDTLVKTDFLTRVNFLTGELFTETEYTEYVTVWLNKNPINLEFGNADNATDKIVYFDDNTLIKQIGTSIDVYYRNLVDEIADNLVYIKEYNEQCSIYVEQEQKFNFTYEDDLSFETEQNIPTDVYNTLTESEETFEIIILSTAGSYIATVDDYYLFSTDGYYMRTVPI